MRGVVLAEPCGKRYAIIEAGKRRLFAVFEGFLRVWTYLGLCVIPCLVWILYKTRDLGLLRGKLGVNQRSLRCGIAFTHVKVLSRKKGKF